MTFSAIDFVEHSKPANRDLLSLASSLHGQSRPDMLYNSKAIHASITFARILGCCVGIQVVPGS